MLDVIIRVVYNLKILVVHHHYQSYYIADDGTYTI